MAVYTEIDDESLAAFLADYDLGGAVSCKGIAEGVENSNYMLATENGTVFLTLYEKRVDPADLPFFLGLMEHLAAHGVACPTPVKARDGRALRELCGKPAAIVTFMIGVSAKKPTPADCAAVGAALARLHLAGRDFAMTRANALSVAGWRRLIGDCGPAADKVLPDLFATLQAELADIAPQWPAPRDDLPFGVIHADAFPDNVLFLNHQVSAIIDFYFACCDFLAYDLAILLNAWCFEADGAFNLTKGQHLLRGYQSVRPLTAAERAMLPLFARGSAMRFLLTRLYDWLNQVPGALVRPKDPLEYWRKLNFHRGVAQASAYGLD